MWTHVGVGQGEVQRIAYGAAQGDKEAKEDQEENMGEAWSEQQQGLDVHHRHRSPATALTSSVMVSDADRAIVGATLRV